MQNALAGAIATLLRIAGVNVIHRRGDQTWSIRAVPGRSEQPLGNYDSMPSEYRLQHFILDGSQITEKPRDGDLIEWGTRRFEVLSEGVDQAVTEMSALSTGQRVRTKELT